MLQKKTGVGKVARKEMYGAEFLSLFSGLFKDDYVMDTVNHLYTHIQEAKLQRSMRG